MPRSITARAPGKLILSGEHSVVYGKPALAMAVNRYVYTTINTQSPSEVAFELLNLKYKRGHSLEKLRKLKTRLQNAYAGFQRGEHSIRDVLKKPFELMQYTATNMVDRLNLSLTQGIKIHTDSTIPIGCGMGSSAATVVSTNHALSHFYHQPLLLQQHIELGLDAENLQHGNSSGLDLRLAIQGGCIFYVRGEVSTRPAPSMPFQIVNTGTPLSTTGECVKHAASLFTADLLDEFSATTLALDAALSEDKKEMALEAIRNNHRLLTQIEVVPTQVQHFIQTLEARGMAAKICGAGSIRGNAAGIVLIAGEGKIEDLVQDYHYILESIAYEARGVQIV